MPIIAIANTKGGVGKSTIAVHLTAWLHEQGHKVKLIDCDSRQLSSSEWLLEACPDVASVILDDANEVLEELWPLAKEYDYVIVDGPGTETEISRSILMRADLAIMPCKASMLEARALTKATRLLFQAQDTRNGLPNGVIILNMVGSRHRLTNDMVDAAEVLGLPLAKQRIVRREVWAEAPGQGSTVLRMKGEPSNKAAKEIRKLFAELLPDAVCGKSPAKRKKKR